MLYASFCTFVAVTKLIPAFICKIPGINITAPKPQVAIIYKQVVMNNHIKSIIAASKYIYDNICLILLDLAKYRYIPNIKIHIPITIIVIKL